MFKLPLEKCFKCSRTFRSCLGKLSLSFNKLNQLLSNFEHPSASTLIDPQMLQSTFLSFKNNFGGFFSHPSLILRDNPSARSSFQDGSWFEVVSSPTDLDILAEKGFPLQFPIALAPHNPFFSSSKPLELSALNTANPHLVL